MSRSSQKLKSIHVLRATLVAIPMMLIGCSQLPEIVTAVPARLMTVSIQASDTRESIASKYDARVLTFHPETGQAVLALSKDRAARLSREAYDSTDPNENTLESQQDTSASGINTNMGGWSTWGSGWSVYGSGEGTGDLSANSSTGPNAAVWQKLRLPQALGIAKKAGAGMTVAVIDTGIDLTHTAFAGHLVASDQMWDFVDGDPVPQEVYVNSTSKGYGHGTSVAGIILQVAPNAKIMPLRVLGSDGAGNSDAVIAAIDWAMAQGANVINLSLGTQYLQSLDSEIIYATHHGVLVVSSTGNTADTSVTFPANDSKVSNIWGDLTIGVASTNLNDQKSWFSTYGDVEVTAIGENIVTPAPGNRVASWTGTSMAAPMVTGGIVLALSERWYSWYSLLELGRSVAYTADNIDKKNDKKLKGSLGFGRLNLERFVQTVLSLR